MARPQADTRLGFFPAAPEAVTMIACRLKPPSKPFAMLDPCAGKGAAIAQLAAALGCRPELVHAVELEADRAAELRAALPAAQVLAPASAFGCVASYGGFALAYANPPYGDQYGGQGRTEDAWLKHVTPWLAPHGILVLVCPESVIQSKYFGVPHFLTEWFHSVAVLPFPAAARHYQEVAVLAIKRPRPLEEDECQKLYGSYAPSWDDIQAPPGYQYQIPSAGPPKRFQKVEPTEEELAAALAGSPLRDRWRERAAFQLPSPPLALGTGHLALLLASGHLDGLVQPPGESPHLVRGTSRKKQYLVGREESETEKGESVVKTTYGERMELIVRAVDLSGSIKTFGSEPEEQEDTDAVTPLSEN